MTFYLPLPIARHSQLLSRHGFSFLYLTFNRLFSLRNNSINSNRIYDGVGVFREHKERNVTFPDQKGDILEKAFRFCFMDHLHNGSPTSLSPERESSSSLSPPLRDLPTSPFVDTYSLHRLSLHEGCRRREELGRRRREKEDGNEEGGRCERPLRNPRVRRRLFDDDTTLVRDSLSPTSSSPFTDSLPCSLPSLPLSSSFSSTSLSTSLFSLSSSLTSSSVPSSSSLSSRSQFESSSLPGSLPVPSLSSSISLSSSDSKSSKMTRSRVIFCFPVTGEDVMELLMCAHYLGIPNIPSLSVSFHLF